MGMEIKLTDIRGEPPLKVGEFILDKDNNVMYVGTGDFELERDREYLNKIFAKFDVKLQLPPDVKFSNVVILNQRYNDIKSAFIVELEQIVDVKFVRTVTLNQNYNDINYQFEIQLFEVVNGSTTKSITLNQTYGTINSSFNFE